MSQDPVIAGGGGRVVELIIVSLSVSRSDAAMKAKK
jgi:hypothetical protein